tara:strand:+ start:368 stop:661 length:294 start_codon:yes stop_codon:yes gene_type:complete
MAVKNKIIIDGMESEHSDYICGYGCGRDISETEISETPYATYICGDIECWNSFCLEFWNPLEVEEEEVEVCEGCELDEDTSYNGFCDLCWKDLNENK